MNQSINTDSKNKFCFIMFSYVEILPLNLSPIYQSTNKLEPDHSTVKIPEETFGPRQANLVLIAYASSEGSGEPAPPRSLPEPLLLAHTSSESRGTFRQKTRSLAPLNGWACAVKICHDGMLEDTNSLDGAHLNISPYRDRGWGPHRFLYFNVSHSEKRYMYINMDKTNKLQVTVYCFFSM